jgi:hypothetical protein
MNNITVKEDRGKVTVTISGAAYRNLQHMAEALNVAANYDGRGDNTAATVTDLLFSPEMERLCDRDGAREEWGEVLSCLEYVPEHSMAHDYELTPEGGGVKVPMPQQVRELEAERESKLKAYPIAFEEEK